jgi:hypothetical protein
VPTTTNLALPYPNAADNPTAAVFAAPILGIDALIGPWTDWSAALVVSQPGSIAKTVQMAKYRLISKEVEFKFRVLMTAAGTGGNAIVISGFPITPAYNTLEVCRGMAARDLPSHANEGMLVNVAAANTWNIRDSGGIVTTAIANGNILAGFGRFEVS